MLVRNMWCVVFDDASQRLYLGWDGITADRGQARPFGEAKYALKAIAKLPAAERERAGIDWDA